ncbi:SdiA-regulated domain-containing protein [Marinifilum sp. D714]|uniref:SdiA-regulated domain-containing protein n=1 Tax=Marinifilum sp. D714 TaxID=2937523 RepID=UPI0027CC3E9A|nr:SdiA-regulated domain-containing protein [Marinifilum sp. D714]MDQ2177130.1 SdiA-regulated domain-containing protein [Marinifilum sp. D714]
MTKIFHTLICLFALVFFLEACAQKKDQKMIYLSENYEKFPYDIYEPDKKYELKDHLREISALSYFTEYSLLCVNDEKGIIYKFNHKKKEVTKKYEFDKPGDYEGVEMVDSLVYVLRSDGRIFKVDHLRDKNIHSVKRTTHLNAGNDTEGLGYDPSTNSLLVACKGSPAHSNKYRGKRAIYEFSIDKNELSKEPKYLIDQDQIRRILEFDAYSRFSVRLMENINPAQGDLTFQPSAVAVHPITRNLYVVGSVGKLLVVLNPKGEIKAIVKLKRKIFRQPEGICFAPDGTMFISNEGKGSKANILKYSFKQ